MAVVFSALHSLPGDLMENFSQRSKRTQRQRQREHTTTKGPSCQSTQDPTIECYDGGSRWGLPWGTASLNASRTRRRCATSPTFSRLPLSWPPRLRNHDDK
ncbi:hypothetical protein CCHR01_14917 [Colletotrichum chrysophilum]|uniref:Uncharacterized protein n=1 Tax=Colletotrichum chrysophilum TaxID=1836956 RepID=A0AAD9A6L6_9PEZI|nr:hypothetical protein CCHR01_14917 [Colletotrichum chrysophilum]